MTSSSEQAAPRTLGPEEAAAAPDHTSRVTAAGSAPPSGSPTAARPPPRAQEAGRGVAPSPRPSEASGGQGGASTPTHRVLLTELIGDTSILDDLFRPSPRTAQQRGSPRTPPAPRTLRTGASSEHPKLPSEPSASTTTKDLTHTAALSHAPAPTQPSPRPPERSKGSRKDFWDILNEGNEESINRLTDLSEVRRMCESAAARPAGRAAEERQSAGLWKTNDKFLWKK